MLKRLLTACVLFVTPTHVHAESYVVKVTHVKDGDTFVTDRTMLGQPVSIRIHDINTPEKGNRARCDKERDAAQAATLELIRLLADSNFTVTLNHVRLDKYGGRWLAQVITRDGTNVARHLVQNGFAKKYLGEGPKPDWCN